MTEVKSLELGKGNKLVYIVDMDEPDASFERNKLAKIDELALFTWRIKHELIFDEKLNTSRQVFKRLLEMMDEQGIEPDELTF